MQRKQEYLFSNIRECERCKRPLPEKYDRLLCPMCEEQELFERVKLYIRENDVNEYQVSEEFGIPLSKVKGWIKEGRIEYKDASSNTFSSNFCARCGERIAFGTLCSKCMRNEHRNGSALGSFRGQSGRIRFNSDGRSSSSGL